MPTVILVHGDWHGSWCWSLGHRAARRARYLLGTCRSRRPRTEEPFTLFTVEPALRPGRLTRAKPSGVTGITASSAAATLVRQIQVIGGGEPISTTPPRRRRLACSGLTPPVGIPTEPITVARADPDIIGLIQGYDGRNQPMVIPALAIAGASLDARNEEADELLAGLELLDNITIAALNGAEQAARLAEVVARTGLDPWDADAAAIADAAVCPTLTLNGAKWREHAADLDEPLHIVEIADLGEQYPED